MKNQVRHLEEDNENLTKKIEETELVTEELKHEIQTLQDANSREDKKGEKLEECMKRIGELEVELEKKITETKAAESKTGIVKTKLNEEVERLKTENTSLHEKVEELESRVQSLGQAEKLNEVYKKKLDEYKPIRDELANLKNQNAELSASISEGKASDASNSKYRDMYKDASEELALEKKLVTKLELEMESLRKDFTDKQSSIEKLANKVSSLESQKGNLKKELEILRLAEHEDQSIENPEEDEKPAYSNSLLNNLKAEKDELERQRATFEELEQKKAIEME